MLREKILAGLPVLGTCAGLILLADAIEGEPSGHLRTLPVTVKRNAYGRQLGSFVTLAPLKGIGEFPMTFIRAPYISEVAAQCDAAGTAPFWAFLTLNTVVSVPGRFQLNVMAGFSRISTGATLLMVCFTSTFSLQ